MCPAPRTLANLTHFSFDASVCAMCMCAWEWYMPSFFRAGKMVFRLYDVDCGCCVCVCVVQPAVLMSSA